MWREIVAGSVLCFALVAASRADEQVRRVEEELRKRNLYFGDVDGQRSPQLVRAVRQYQERKGFSATGDIDPETAASLDVAAAATDALKPAATKSWPDLPVLRSDTARAVPAEAAASPSPLPARVAATGPSPAPMPPAEAPHAATNLSPERVQKFVEDYLREGEASDIAAQTKFYAEPVAYFDHGRVSKTFVEKDTRNYCRRWPQRKYMLLGPVNLSGGPADDTAAVNFRIAFSVQNKKSSVDGKTENFWTIKPDGETFRILAIREERVRD